MLKRITPPRKFENIPCSILAASIAVEMSTWTPWDPEEEDIRELKLPENIKIRDDGYLTLNGMNNLVRKNLMVKKRLNYKKGERPLLKEYIPNNQERAIICVLGHYIYQEYDTYYSFFDNDNDEVVSVWILK